MYTTAAHTILQAGVEHNVAPDLPAALADLHATASRYLAEGVPGTSVVADLSVVPISRKEQEKRAKKTK